MSDKRLISPSIVAPSRPFLIGAVLGYNAARKKTVAKPAPMISSDKEPAREVKNEDLYIGGWLEVKCAFCGNLYSFSHPNEVPEKTLQCNNEDCNNILILYGVEDHKKWKIGGIKLL